MSIGVYNWNLRKTSGAVSGSRISETEMDLHLGLRLADESTEEVGRFHLPLLLLYEGGFVTRRDTKEGNFTFSVRIVRTDDGRYFIASRNKRTPLAPYAVGA